MYIQGIAENRSIQCFVCNSSFENRIYFTTNATKDGFFTAYIDKDDIDTICCVYHDGENPLTILLYYEENISITNFVNNLIGNVEYLSEIAGKKENIEFPRDYTDYNATVNLTEIPNGIQIGFKYNPFEEIIWNKPLNNDWLIEK